MTFHVRNFPQLEILYTADTLEDAQAWQQKYERERQVIRAQFRKQMRALPWWRRWFL